MTAQSNTQSRVAKIEALRVRHNRLSDQIEQARKSPGIADYVLQDLKKQKLNLKDEIAKMDQGSLH